MTVSHPQFSTTLSSSFYPLHQRHLCCVAENNCPPHQFLSITTITSIFTIVYSIHIYSCSFDRSMYSCNESNTRSFILLVLEILCPLPTRSRTWNWWLMWDFLIPTVIAWLIAVCNKNLWVFDGSMLTVGGYYCRGIPKGNLVMYHLKKDVYTSTI